MKSKKTYIAPVTKIIYLQQVLLLVGSGVTSNGIGYGGVDGDGSLDPAAPPSLDLDWD